jgi:hypothetical protein
MKFVISKTCILLLSFFAIECASVPKEVVELSYKTGEDIAALYKSYDKLIQEYYEKMRQERIAYIEDVWYPKFLKSWMRKGELGAIAKGEKIWSVTEGKLIANPGNANSEESFQTLNDWITYALYAREVKEDSLLQSLNHEEKMLRENVDMAFQQVIRANSTITSHLNSLRKVQEIEDDAFKVLSINNLRNNITSTLSNASARANKEFDKIREQDKDIKDLTSQIEAYTKTK